MLERLTVAEVLDPVGEIQTVPPGMPFARVLDLVASSPQSAFPVVDGEGRMVGIFTVNDVRRVVTSPEVWSVLVASDLGTGVDSAAWVAPDDDLHSAQRRFSAFQLEVLPVLASAPPAPLIGLLQQGRLMEAYDREVHRLQSEDGAG